MKKITLSILLFLSVHFSFSQEVSDYISGLDGPTKMIADGTILYVNGWEKIYMIDTADSSPEATLLYTLPADFYAYKTLKLGNNLFILVENWDEETDTFVGMQIVKLDLTNVAAGTQVVINSPNNFIASFALVGNIIYYSNESETAPDVYTTDIYSFDATQSPAVSVLEYTDFDLNNEAVDDVEVYNNVLFLSSGGAEKIFKFDLSSSTSEPEEYLNTTDLNFNKGIYISPAGYLYITNAHEIEKIDVNNPEANLEFIGSQTTQYDTFNGNPFLANFRDVVRVGTTLYMTLENQGKIVTLTDTALGTSDFIKSEVKVYPNPVVSDLFIVDSADFKEYALFDLTGKKVQDGTLASNIINCSQLQPGVYFLNLKGETKQGHFKIIKQ